MLRSHCWLVQPQEHLRRASLCLPCILPHQNQLGRQCTCVYLIITLQMQQSKRQFNYGQGFAKVAVWTSRVAASPRYSHMHMVRYTLSTWKRKQMSMTSAYKAEAC